MVLFKIKNRWNGKMVVGMRNGCLDEKMVVGMKKSLGCLLMLYDKYK